MAAKAVIVVSAPGVALPGVEATLVTSEQSEVFPLTNGDGYALSLKSWGAWSGYLKIVANGYLSYLQPLTLDNENQNIFVGEPSTDPNAIILPPLQKAGSSFPKYPTREQVCNIFCGFQGISILTKQYGWIPAFGPEVGNLDDEDTISYCKQMKELSFTHVELAISWQYDEPDFEYPVPGLDLAYNLEELARRMDLIIRQGMFIKLSVSGDGMSVNDNPSQGQYNDPQGWTYGYQWALNNLQRITEFLSDYKGHDLTRFTIFVPGYDAVFYGWGIPGEVPDQQPQRVINFGSLFRMLLPHGNLGIEHSTGKIPIGESGIDWTTGGPLDAYDTLLSEYDPFNLHSDNTWQILGRCTRPYNRPSDQPANDDPHPPYIIQACTRGPRFYIMYELLTYLWVRKRCSLQDCNDAYDYFKAMAPEATLCMVRQ
jgi:hypothetical protein